jgi:hypothetical protein
MLVDATLREVMPATIGLAAIVARRGKKKAPALTGAFVRHEHGGRGEWHGGHSINTRHREVFLAE